MISLWHTSLIIIWNLKYCQCGGNLKSEGNTTDVYILPRLTQDTSHFRTLYLIVTKAAFLQRSNQVNTKSRSTEGRKEMIG